VNLSGKRILVTGADGFIGSHLVEQLLVEGYEVRCFVLYNSFNSWGWLDSFSPSVKSGLDVFAGDIRDPVSVRTAMEGCDLVLHLAALIAIPHSYRAPYAYVETNVTGTLNVLQAARDLGVEKVVHTSTSEVYGTAQFVPITEAHPLNAQSPYAATKVGADQLAMSFHYAFDVPVAVIRPFNTYGPRQSARAVIPTIISQIAAGADTIALGALTPTRDFNYVIDTARGFIAMAESDLAVGKVTNIGSDYEVSIAELAGLIAEVMRREVSIELDKQRLRPAASEVERLWADNTKARERLDWVPNYGGLDGLRRGLKETAAWFSEPGNLALYKAEQYNQ